MSANSFEFGRLQNLLFGKGLTPFCQSMAHLFYLFRNSDSYEEFELYWLEKVCEWEAEEMEPKFQAILEGYQKLVDEAMEEEIEKIQNKDGDEGVKAFMEDEEAQKALKQKVLAANGITKEKFFNDAEKVVGRLRELKTLKDFMDALEEK